MRLTTVGTRRGLAAAMLAGAGLLGACRSFLESDKAVADPNNPTSAATNQLLVGAAANLMGLQESGMAMIICQWVQQCAGVGGRFVEEQANYTNINVGSFNGTFSAIYSGGGLIQLRDIQKRSDGAGDKVTKGVAEVMEAMVIGFGADIWGDIPYREAAIDNAAPKADPQMQIYDDLQALLDRAITDLGGAGAGPGATDLFYGGNKTKWTELANTLKARYYLHTVEKLGVAQYAKALAAAQKGISAPGNDFNDPHTDATSERNMWAQFQLSSFGADLVAGKPLVDIMVAQQDPRLPLYFGKNSSGGYGGHDQATGNTPPSQVSTIAGSERASNGPSPQPIVTYDENQLILAEASLMQAGGSAAAAAPFLNRVRARYGKPAIAAPTLTDIMHEKYIALFQNVEYWNDYKRTCLPALKPAAGKSAVPGRFLFPESETQTNKNAPDDSNLNIFTSRNANDPNSCR
jgi:starch-binding outer membrane protein, SusD/RagB family